MLERTSKGRWYHQKIKCSYESTLGKLKESPGRDSDSFKRQHNDGADTTSRKALFIAEAQRMPDTDISQETEDVFLPPRPFTNALEVCIVDSFFFFFFFREIFNYMYMYILTL